MAQLNFDANTVDPSQSFDPVPAGWYPLQITASEMKPTANGNGAYLQLEMTILDGEFKNRKIFDRLNLQNQNTTTVEIAYKTLSAICHAVNIIQVQDSAQLHGLPMEAKVIVKPPANGYDAGNEIRGYRAIGSGNGAGAAAPGAGQPPVGMPAQQPVQQPPTQQAPPAQQFQQPPAQQFQPPAQQQPPAGYTAPQQPAQQPATQQQPPAAQQQPPAAWGTPPAQQQPAVQQPPAGHPTQGPAPSAGGVPGAPPWGVPPQA